MSFMVGKQYTLAHEGPADAVLAAVQDLGMVDSQYGTKHKVRFIWLIDGQFDEEKKPVLVWQTMTNSMHEKATLRKTVRSITGKDPGNGLMDVEPLIGISKQLIIEHNADATGRKFANIAAVLKPQKQVVIPAGWVPPAVKQPAAVQAAMAGPGPQRATIPTSRVAPVPASNEITDEDIPF